MAVKFSQFTTRTGTLDASTKVVGYDDIGGTKTNVEIELSEFFANIPVATTTTIGGVKLGAAGANVTIPSATVVSGRYYPLQVSTESGYEQRGYMNVPWENIALNNLTMSGARTYQMDIGNGQGFDLTFFNNFTGNTSKVIFNNSGGVQIAENLTIVKNLIIQGQAYTELHTGAAIDGIDWDSGNVQEVTLPAGSSDFDPSNAKAGATYILKITQPSGGDGIINWDNIGTANIKWPGGTEPTLTATNAAIDIVTLICTDATGQGVYYANATLNFS